MPNTQSVIAGVRRLFGVRSRRERPALSALNDELLYDVARAKSLDELLVAFPRRITAAFHLTSFHIFLLGQKEYVLQSPAQTPRVALPASCSTVSHLKRERKPAMFFAESGPAGQPDPWQLLATAHEIEILAALQTQMLLPLEGRTGLIGFLALGRTGGAPFSDLDMEFFGALGAQMGRGLETAQLINSLNEEAARRSRVQRELELAREVQERLLPGNLPAFPGLAMAAAYRSAEQVGGDYYDAFLTPTGALCGVVADVSGKGISAALLMATLRASLHSLMLDTDQPPVVVIERLGRLLFHASSMSRYATLFFFLYEPSTCEMTFVNAGHNPPILIAADGTLTRLTCGGPVLGLLPEADYAQETIVFRPGDTLVAYTDGVTEACSADGTEWGEEGLLALLELHAGATVASLVDQTMADLSAFSTGCPQSDDITLFVVRRTAAY